LDREGICTTEHCLCRSATYFNYYHSAAITTFLGYYCILYHEWESDGSRFNALDDPHCGEADELDECEEMNT